jgi:hypothetical protein
MAQDQPEDFVPAESIQVRFHWPDAFRPIAVSFVGLSRLNADVQLDLGHINYQRFAEYASRAEEGPTVLDVEVTHSAYLTMGGFLKLREDINRFYELLRRDGYVREDE